MVWTYLAKRGGSCDKISVKIEIPGRRGPGRLKRRLMDCIEQDMLEKNLRTTDAIEHTCWKRLIKNGDPA